MSDLGHNSDEFAPLKAYVERIQRLENDQKEIKEDIKSVYDEAKHTGYDVKIMRKLVALMKRDLADLSEEEQLLDLYCAAVGFQPSLLDKVAG